MGYEAIQKIEKYVKRNKDIKIVKSSDSVFSSSIIVLIPHPTFGITMMFIPQNSLMQNQMFLYPKEYANLINTLTEMRTIFQ